MWPSAEGNVTAIDSPSSIKKLPSYASNSSSSTCTCSPSSLFLPNSTRKKTMEEVWKDIGLSSLHEKRPTTALEDGPNTSNNSNAFRGIILQDFLARPFNDPSTNPLLFGSSSSSSPPPPPTTALSLNSGPEFPNLDALATFHAPSNNSDCHRFPNAASVSFSFMADTPKTAFDAFGSSPALSSLCNKKRITPADPEENSGDRRHKRMIKNRESAARSRARKQAWSYNRKQLILFLPICQMNISLIIAYFPCSSFVGFSNFYNIGLYQ